MADGVTIEIRNARNLVADLREFSEDVAVRTVKASVRRIGAYVLQRLKSNTPAFTGKLRFNLSVAAKYVRRRGVVVAQVRVNTKGKAKDERNAYYWRFVEFGHKTRPGAKGVKTLQATGTRYRKDGTPYTTRVWKRPRDRSRQRLIPGQEFVAKTSVSTQSAVAQMFFSDLQKAIDRAQRRNR